MYWVNFIFRITLWLICVSAYAQTPAIDMGPATPYNGFFFENFTAQGSDVQGRLAIGHTGALNHYSVGDQLDPDNAGDVLVVSGNLAFPSGRVYFGNILVGGQASAVGNAVINGLAPGATLQAGVAVPVDFPTAAQQLTQLSQDLSQLSANTTFQSQWGGLYLHGDGSSQLQVFQLPGDLVLKAHTFQVDGIPDGAWVVFNIDGVQTGLTNMSLNSLQPHRTRVLFNFFQAANLKLRGIAVEGSVLAPLAHVANPQGVLHGQIVAKSWNGPMQLNHVAFEPFDPAPPNQPPFFTSVPVLEGVATRGYPYVATASDPDSDLLTFSLVSGLIGMTIDPVTGQINWTPAEDQVGDHPVTLRVEDPDGLFDTQSFTITVAEPPNRAPVFTSTPVATATLRELYLYGVTATDPDGDDLSFAVTEGPVGMFIDPVTGDVTWTPADGQGGHQLVTLRVSDPEGLTDTQSFQITVVTPENRPPRITSTPVTPHLLSPIAGDASVFDLSTWTQFTYIQSTLGQPRWTFNNDFTQARQNNNSKPSALLSDTELDSGQISGTLRVDTPSDDDAIGFVFGWQDPRNFYLFEWRAGSQQLGLGLALQGMSLKVMHSDPQLSGEAIVAPTTPDPADGQLLYHNDIPWQDRVDYEFTLEVHPGQFTVTVRRGATVLDSFTLFDDTHGQGKFGFYNFSQEQVVYQGFNQTVAASREYHYELTANDPDGDPLQWTLLEGPEGLSLDTVSGQMFWPTTTQDTGTYPIRVRVEDSQGGADEQNFSLIVSHEVPVITSQAPPVARAGALYIYDVGAVDPDPAATFTFELTQAPPGMTVETATGRVAWTPEVSQLGTHTVTVQLTDDQGHTDTQTFEVTVVPLGNQPPVVTSTPDLDATLHVPYHYQTKAFDPDGDALLYLLRQGPNGMQIDPLTGFLSWDPQPLQVGSQQVRVEVWDTAQNRTLHAFTLELSNNAKPAFTSTPPTTASEGVAYSYAITTSDPDGDAVSLHLVTAPDGMTLDAGTGTLTWTPTGAQSGSHSVVLEARDVH